MAEHQWFYQKDSLIGTTDNIGPLPERELFTLVKDGKLKRETLVSCQSRTNGAWHQVQRIPALLKAIEQGDGERKEERERQAREKEAERQTRTAERQRQAEMRQAESELQAGIASQQREVLRQRREQEDAIRRAMFKPREYPAMKAIVALLYGIAVLVAASFLIQALIFIVSICLADSESRLMTASMGLMALSVSLLVHVIAGVILAAIAESIRVVIDIQHNTQETAFYANAVAHPPQPGALPLNPIVAPPAVH